MSASFTSLVRNIVNGPTARQSGAFVFMEMAHARETPTSLAGVDDIDHHMPGLDLLQRRVAGAG